MPSATNPVGCRPAWRCCSTRPHPTARCRAGGVRHGHDRSVVAADGHDDQHRVAPLDVAQAALTGANAGGFAITQDGYTGTTVALDATCDVVVRFTPQAPGGKTAALRTTDNAASASADVAPVRLGRGDAAVAAPDTTGPPARDVIAPAFLGHANASLSKLKAPSSPTPCPRRPASSSRSSGSPRAGRSAGPAPSRPHANLNKKACTRSTRVGAVHGRGRAKGCQHLYLPRAVRHATARPRPLTSSADRHRRRR
jgi:hypothetical protein